MPGAELQIVSPTWPPSAPPVPPDADPYPRRRRLMPVRLVSQEELPGPLKGYRLLERPGRGGFGEVRKAEAPGGFLTAVKITFGDLDAATDAAARPAGQER